MYVHSCLSVNAPLHRAQRGSNEEQVGIDIASTPGDEEKVEQRPAVAAGSLLRTLTGPQVSVALGIGILLAVLANRIATPELVDSQARTDILGVIASGGLVTNGVYLLVRVHHGRSPRTSCRGGPVC